MGVMLKSLKSMGFFSPRGIKDVADALPGARFRGLPEILNIPCPNACFRCAEVCPTYAVRVNPVRVDLQRCIFCPECERECPEGKIRFGNSIDLATTNPQSMVITVENKTPVLKAGSFNLFKRSLSLFNLSCGGCNGCELELAELSNVRYDIRRFGIDFTTTPLHADGVLITGPMTQNMADVAEDVLRVVQPPRMLVLCGACAISGGVFVGSPAGNRSALVGLKPDLAIAGCPPHPLAVLRGILKLLGR
ncbi:NADH ubiquinone oxidoreductase, 20 kDa subunit [Candidatus Magnetobacterium bavaricum]|uniref:NADH ubiquinone oxidoreductase, 20 kDa subunit n=1 Tax=Candidatus Magnetobacterium bavaricum TaxID=29290 RepID=A0A0F3H1C0_9BACT|nr:NADH ubiquinone oxidoreductase, 20 kDa subunit [Candidatus Magnetobacterium bavaricum]